MGEYQKGFDVGLAAGRAESIGEGAKVKSEPDAWLVQWFRANGDTGTNVYVKESDARSAAHNLEKYSSSETTAGVTPLFASPQVSSKEQG